MYISLKPFAIPIMVLSSSAINMDKIRKDYNLKETANIASLCSVIDKETKNITSEYQIRDDKDESVDIGISETQIKDKYTTVDYQKKYVCKCEQLYYWRKNYEISDFLNEEFINLENCGFYPIDRTLAEYLQDIDRKINPLDFPETDSNIMYHEWY
jgi:hypothetical protein